MVLDYDSLEVINEGEQGYDVLTGLEDERELPPLPPTKIVCHDLGSAKTIKGYFFMPDGKTAHDVEFTLSTDSLFIQAKLEKGIDLVGAAGGPLMTDDHKLVGIVQGVFTGVVDEEMNEYASLKAIQLDLGLPEFLSRSINWATLTIG